MVQGNQRGQWRLAIAVTVIEQFHRVLNGLSDDDAVRNQHRQLQSVPVPNSKVMTLIVFNTGNTNSAVL
ncbi:hypothetical protein CKO09_12880 [Chromatium weissei]|nr:hypothetical protein [Chromatium weissei]